MIHVTVVQMLIVELKIIDQCARVRKDMTEIHKLNVYRLDVNQTQNVQVPIHVSIVNVFRHVRPIVILAVQMPYAMVSIIEQFVSVQLDLVVIHTLPVYHLVVEVIQSVKKIRLV